MDLEEFEKLAEEYDQQTRFHSFAHMNRKTPAYAMLIEAGRDSILDRIIEGFESHKLWGMHWVVVLMDITGEMPIQPQPVAGGHAVAWDVDKTCRAWIQWFRSSALPRTDPPQPVKPNA